jgi:uncharacterized protein YjbI with pentapeptide repeats
MANKEQLEILKQGVDAWNKWRKENPKVEIDLIEANLIRVDLREAYLWNAKLWNADLSGADLSGADLSGSHLDLTILIGTNLDGVNLRRASLSLANFSSANLKDANLGKTIIGNTTFAQIDLSKTHGLEKVIHASPSSVGTDTIQKSKGEIPKAFLRGCGLSEWEIESAKLYKPGLSNQEINDIIYKIFDLRANQSIQISPLFISYSHTDNLFVEKLETYLAKKGIRFWRDVHDATSGRLEKQIDHAMRNNPTVILILSENSTRSDWVEHEAHLARDLEKEIGRDVLCPIALDDSWKTAKWPKRLMEQIMEYNILDYSKWNDDIVFGQVFNKMLSGLDMFYKPEGLK